MFAQGDIDNSRKILFTNEATPVIGLYSNGWGFGFIRARRLAGQTKRTLEIQFSEVKHPKEVRLSSYGQSVVYGKMNDHYQLSLLIGRQKELIAKADRGSVAIRLSYSIGFCLGMEKPVYFEIDTSYNSNKIQLYSIERFSKNRSFAATKYNTLWFGYGLSETVFVPGVTARSSFDLDFSNNPLRVKSLVLGAAVQIFPRKIEIMASDDNASWFVSLFVAWRFGWIYSKY